MKRRFALQTLLGSPALWAQELTPVATDIAGEPRLRFFSKTEFSRLEELAKVIVPAVNGQPGAMEAGAPMFLDFLLSRSLPGDRRAYRSGLAGTVDLWELERPWKYGSKSFAHRLKEDLIRATFNSREANANRRGGGVGQYWKAFD
jgi:hypothetical protein